MKTQQEKLLQCNRDNLGVERAPTMNVLVLEKFCNIHERATLQRAMSNLFIVNNKCISAEQKWQRQLAYHVSVS